MIVFFSFFKIGASFFSLRMPPTPYCDKIKTSSGSKMVKTECSAEKTSLSICNLSPFVQVLPAEYQNFDSIPGVSDNDVAHYGGSVDLADFCPFMQVNGIFKCIESLLWRFCRIKFVLFFYYRNLAGKLRWALCVGRDALMRTTNRVRNRQIYRRRLFQSEIDRLFVWLIDWLISIVSFLQTALWTLPWKVTAVGVCALPKTNPGPSELVSTRVRGNTGAADAMKYENTVVTFWSFASR